VLAHDRGGGGKRVPALLGVPHKQCRNFVLEVRCCPAALLAWRLALLAAALLAWW
jgi:hypothetical protein